MQEESGLVRHIQKLKEEQLQRQHSGPREQPKRAGHRGRGYTKPSFYNKRRREKRRIRRKMAKRSQRINRR